MTEQQELADEVYDYLKDIFNGTEEPPVCQDQGDQQQGDTGGAGQQQDPPVMGGQGDHGYNVDPQPELHSSKGNSSLKDDPSGFLDRDFTVREVKEMITTLGTGKAAGWDEVPNEALKEAPDLLVRVLVRLYNSVKNSGVVPQSWKRGRLVLVHKKG